MGDFLSFAYLTRLPVVDSLDIVMNLIFILLVSGAAAVDTLIYLQAYGKRY